MNWTVFAEWTVYAEPMGKAIRPTTIGGHASMCVQPKSRKHMNDIKMQSLPHRPETLIYGPVRLTIKAYRLPPKSFSKKKLAAALAGDIRPTQKPDLDNIEKAVCDSLSKLFFVDDALIVEHGPGHGKYYGEPARYEIKIETEA